ncbi:MAG: hypothetical protein MUC63_05645 [Planctomycetes bacterium]|jgi:hypothetical protein|nr:hypothetical protein [Planctomycetota bacterium]MCU0728084.1 hypothetical protein [Planctomycetota bacterium]
MEVKGSAIATIRPFVKTAFGADGERRFLDSLSPGAKSVIASPILATEWYPLKTALVEPVARICDLFFRGDLEGARESGRFSADQGLRGIYRVFVKLGSPAVIVKKAGTILPTYYRPSAMEVLENGAGRAVVRMTQFPQRFRVVEERICGWMQRAIEISGGKSVRVEVPVSMTEGDGVTEFRITWA